MNYYWELRYGDWKDLKRIIIPPSAVDTVKRRWDNGEPIHTTTGSIPANQIKEFEITDKLFNPQPLIEDVARVFNEPVLTEDGSVVARWVKRPVTRQKWEKYYSISQGYRYLDDQNGMVMMAFSLPVHQIDLHNTTYCSQEELIRLTNKR